MPIILTDSNGTVALASVEQVQYISSPFQKAGQPQSRKLILTSGATVYMLDTQANLDALAPLSDGLEPGEDVEPQAPAKRRGRPRKA